MVVFGLSDLPITIAPNPAREELGINLSSYRDMLLNYTIIDMQGRVMNSGRFGSRHSDLEVINLQNFDNGSYFIYIKPEKHRSISMKFVVMKEY